MIKSAREKHIFFYTKCIDYNYYRFDVFCSWSNLSEQHQSDEGVLSCFFCFTRFRTRDSFLNSFGISHEWIQFSFPPSFQSCFKLWNMHVLIILGFPELTVVTDHKPLTAQHICITIASLRRSKICVSNLAHRIIGSTSNTALESGIVDAFL